METTPVRLEAPEATYGADTATPLSRAPITAWHRRLLRVLRVGADDGTETRLIVLVGSVADCAAVLGAALAEGWQWRLNDEYSFLRAEHLPRTLRLVPADERNLPQLNRVRPWLAGHTVLLWVSSPLAETILDQAPDLMSWARAVLDLRTPDSDYPQAREVLAARALRELVAQDEGKMAATLKQLGTEIQGAAQALQEAHSRFTEGNVAGSVAATMKQWEAEIQRASSALQEVYLRFTDGQVAATLKQWETGLQRASQALQGVHSRIAQGLRGPAGRTVSDLLLQLDEANTLRLKGVSDVSIDEPPGESHQTSTMPENPLHMTVKG